MSEKVSDERLVELEKAMVKIEGTVGVLAEKMTDIASAVNTMSHGISKLAVTDTKVESLSDDIRHLADAHRSAVSRTDSQIKDIYERINAHHENHNEYCETNTKETTENFEIKLQRIENKALMYFVWGVTVATSLFSYNHFAIDNLNAEKKAHLERVAEDRKLQAVENAETKIMLQTLLNQVGELKSDLRPKTRKKNELRIIK